MAQAPIQFDRASGVLEGANAWERLAAVALTLGSKVGANFSHFGYNRCANLLRKTLPERGIQVRLNPDAVFDAVLREGGALRVPSIEQLLDVGHALAVLGEGRLPTGRRIAVLTASGGFGVLLADAASAQGLTLPAHLSSFPDALAATIARYGDRMKPGDVDCLNDPFEGGMHIPDVFVLKPIFHEGERVAFAATICHQTDMGGRVAGSNASDSTTTSSTSAVTRCWLRG